MERTDPDYVQLKWDWLNEIARRRARFGPRLQHRPIAAWQSWRADPGSQAPLMITGPVAPEAPGWAFTKVSSWALEQENRRATDALEIRPGLILSNDRLHVQGYAWIAYMSSAGGDTLSVRLPGKERSYCWIPKHLTVSFTQDLPQCTYPSMPRDQMSAEEVARYLKEVENLELVAFEEQFEPGSDPRMKEARRKIVLLLNDLVSESARTGRMLHPCRDPDAPTPGKLVRCRLTNGEELVAVVLDSVILYKDRRKHDNNLVMTCELVNPLPGDTDPESSVLDSGRLLLDANILVEKNEAGSPKVALPAVVSVPLLRPLLRHQIVEVLGDIGPHIATLRKMYHRLRVH